MDINLEVEGEKEEVTNETLTPNYLPSPNEELAQLFDFANDSIAQDPPPIITIRDKNHLTEDPQMDGFCYSDDTEVLTENGWMLLKDVVENKLKVKIATLNPEKNVVEYHHPVNYFKFEYKGKMFQQKSRRIDLLVTPNHKLWVGNQNKKDFKFIKAREVPRKVSYKKDFPFKGSEKEFFELPEYSVTYMQSAYVDGLNRHCPKHSITRKFSKRKIPMDDWLRFFGIWLAEGWVSKTKNSQFGRIIISQYEGWKQKERKRMLKDELLSDCVFLTFVDVSSALSSSFGKLPTSAFIVQQRLKSDETIRYRLIFR